jgi:DeoR/GlpR family transcriptional regulator of sugar metabolism
VARALAVRGDLGIGTPALTVVTNALNIANELAVRPQFKIVVTGGVARPQSYELIGPLADGVLGQITLDVAVLGVVAFDVAHGAAAHDEAEAAINRLLCERATRVVVAADSGKLGGRAFARICAAELVDTLVTDTAAPPEAVRPFEEAGIRVITV